MKVYYIENMIRMKEGDGTRGSGGEDITAISTRT